MLIDDVYALKCSRCSQQNGRSHEMSLICVSSQSSFSNRLPELQTSAAGSDVGILRRQGCLRVSSYWVWEDADFRCSPHWCLTAIVVVVSPLPALMEARRYQGKWGPCSGRRARTLARNGRSVAKKAIRVLASLPKFQILLDNVGAIRTHVGADWEHLLQAAHFLSAFLLK